MYIWIGCSCAVPPPPTNFTDGLKTILIFLLNSPHGL